MIEWIELYSDEISVLQKAGIGTENRKYTNWNMCNTQPARGEENEGSVYNGAVGSPSMIK